MAGLGPSAASRFCRKIVAFNDSTMINVSLLSTNSAARRVLPDAIFCISPYRQHGVSQDETFGTAGRLTL
jgi:hypothetical protein